MSKNKKGARGARAARLRASAANSPTPPRRARPDAMAFLTAATHGSTMQDVARNTANRGSHWDQDAKLRSRPVSFVSSGFIDPLERLPVDPSVTSPGLSGQPEETSNEGESNRAAAMAASTTAVTAFPNSGDTAEVPQLHDLSWQADSAAAPSSIERSDPDGLQRLQRYPSKENFLNSLGPVPGSGQESGSTDRSSDSSEEVILFKGRHSMPAKGADFKKLCHKNASVEAPNNSGPVQPEPSSSGPGEGLESNAQLPARLPPEEPDLPLSSDDDDAILKDYIANMQDSDMGDISYQTRFVSRDLGGMDGDVVFESNDNEENLNKVFSGVHLEDGGSELSSDSEDAKFLSAPEELGAVDESDSPAASAPPVPRTANGDGGNAEDEETYKPPENMDDEQLAILLAKQEELGLGGDQLLLYDSSAAGMAMHMPGAFHERHEELLGEEQDNDHDDDYDDDFIRGSKAALSGPYPRASAVADAFEELDLADWKRPNHQGKKGGRGQPSFNVSDSELEAQLKTAWQKDRMRKKEKKEAREALRAQGLLGKDVNPEDPRVKYPTGMALDDIKTEFIAFLLSSDASLTLPPMDSHARKIIHEIAHRFKVTSKSAGSGDQRRPVLYRTKTTAKYAEAYVEQVFARIGRRYFPRLDSTRPARGKGTQASGSGRVNHAAVTVRHGDIVGGGAPGIAESNKGRALLEKMGWTSGMALGASDNKGMTEPIGHVIRRSKAGLG